MKPICRLQGNGCVQAYAQKIKHCLTQISHNEDNIPAAQEVRMWTCQCNSMRIFLAVGDVSKFAVFSSSRLDGAMGAGAKDLTETWYQTFLVSCTAPLRCTAHINATVCCIKQKLVGKTLVGAMYFTFVENLLLVGSHCMSSIHALCLQQFGMVV